MKVVFCTPTLTKPHQAYLEAMAGSNDALEGVDYSILFEIGCPYVSAARATLLRKALDKQPDAVIFIDHDVSWRPQDLRKLIDTPGDVVAGTYRYKIPEERYMGCWYDGPNGVALGRGDGCLSAKMVPAGFLKVTVGAVDKIMRAHPELCVGPMYWRNVDLFNHGAHEGVWYGEDVAFCRRWRAMGEPIWLIPDLSITHHGATEAFPGNVHEYLAKQPKPLTARRSEEAKARIWEAAE